MKQIIKNTPLAFAILIIGAAVIVGGILTMALYHDMSWQSYVIIGVLMVSSLWAMLNLPMSVNMKQKPMRVRNHQR